MDDAGPAACASALLASYARRRVNTSSAGQKPASGLDPAVVRVAAEQDLDLSDAFPKVITGEAVQVADVVVTLGEATLDPTPAERTGQRPRVVHWEVPAVYGLPDDDLRAVLAALDRRVLGLLAELV